MKLNKEQINLLEVVKHLVEDTLDKGVFTTEGLNQNSALSNIFETIGKELVLFDDSIIVYESNN